MLSVRVRGDASMIPCHTCDFNTRFCRTTARLYRATKSQTLRLSSCMLRLCRVNKHGFCTTFPVSRFSFTNTVTICKKTNVCVKSARRTITLSRVNCEIRSTESSVPTPLYSSLKASLLSNAPLLRGIQLVFL